MILPSLARTAWRCWVAIPMFGLATACGQHEPPTPDAAHAPAVTARSREIAALGREIFFDETLSASGKQSCASCHDPKHGYGPPDGLATQLGGKHLDQQGLRAVPSLRYVLNRTPRWAKVYIASTAERLADGDDPPGGGFGWDGRFNSLHEQAEFPLLAPNEMANPSAPDVVRRLAQANYADRFRRTFGDKIFQAPGLAFQQALIAIERFELDDPDLHPFTSKFDNFLDGKVALTDQEARGYKLFNDSQVGNCASCHPDSRGADGSHPLFTTFQFEALGAPRNPALEANRDPRYFDQGLCGPVRTDQSGDATFCGMFKTPGLRNVATRQVFLHNGNFHSLKTVLEFYMQRDTSPNRWYQHDDHGVVAFDDLPPSARRNIDHVDLPLTLHVGQQPLWNDRQINDVIAFLKTLTDADLVEQSR